MLIFLNGSINAGKSTVAKILAKKISSTALVEIDSLREMIEWMPIDEAVPINLENAVSVIRNFAKRNLNVIVPYPLSHKNHDYLVKELNGINTKMYFFTLAPKIEKALENMGTRELTEWEKERKN
jgi:tRNA uridine 5-carbamoylmethylation protein Kti12